MHVKAVLWTRKNGAARGAPQIRMSALVGPLLRRKNTIPKRLLGMIVLIAEALLTGKNTMARGNVQTGMRSLTKRITQTGTIGILVSNTDPTDMVGPPVLIVLKIHNSIGG